MEMRRAPGRSGHFPPGGAQYPMHEFFRARPVLRIPEETAQQQRGVVVQVVKLLTKSAPGAEEIASNFIVHEEDERGLRLPIRVISSEIVRKELAIFEHRINRVAKEPGVAAKLANARAIAPLKPTNFEFFFFDHEDCLPQAEGVLSRTTIIRNDLAVETKEAGENLFPGKFRGHPAMKAAWIRFSASRRR